MLQKGAGLANFDEGGLTIDPNLMFHVIKSLALAQRYETAALNRVTRILRQLEDMLKKELELGGQCFWANLAS